MPNSVTHLKEGYTGKDCNAKISRAFGAIGAGACAPVPYAVGIAETTQDVLEVLGALHVEQAGLNFVEGEGSWAVASDQLNEFAGGEAGAEPVKVPVHVCLIGEGSHGRDRHSWVDVGLPLDVALLWVSAWCVGGAFNGRDDRMPGVGGDGNAKERKEDIAMRVGATVEGGEGLVRT